MMYVMQSGIISGLGRQVRANTRMSASGNGNILFDMIQTDAAINPGNLVQCFVSLCLSIEL